MQKITQIIEKNIKQITSNFVEEGPGRGSEDIKNECNVNCFNTLRKGDADLRFYITNVQDG